MNSPTNCALYLLIFFVIAFVIMRILSNYVLRFIQDPAGIFDLVEVVGNGTYGQVHKVTSELLLQFLVFIFA